MIYRMQYRAVLRDDIDEREFAETCKFAEAEAGRLIDEGKILCAYMYRYEKALFLYQENLTGGQAEEVDPERYMAALLPNLKRWPQIDGDRAFAEMYPVYYHNVPKDVPSWLDGRDDSHEKIGRIAFLKPEKLSSYVKFHAAIVDEGLLKGDKYQFISLHENILFSVFQEPRNNVNLRDSEEPSKVIDEWLAVDPESHFNREKAGGENFRIIEPVFLCSRKAVD